MNEESRSRITEERLEIYRQRSRETFSAPVISIGIRHCPEALGQFVICLVADLPDRIAAAILRSVANQLDPSGQ